MTTDQWFHPNCLPQILARELALEPEPESSGTTEEVPESNKSKTRFLPCRQAAIDARDRIRAAALLEDDSRGPRDLFFSACRLAISTMMRDYRRRHFLKHGQNGVVTCPVLKVKMVEADSHVHHDGIWSFVKIAEAFMSKLRMDLSKIEYCCGEFKRIELAESFIDFHNARAILMVVHRTANIGILRRKSNVDVACSLCGAHTSRFFVHKCPDAVRLAAGLSSPAHGCTIGVRNPVHLSISGV